MFEGLLKNLAETRRKIVFTEGTDNRILEAPAVCGRRISWT
jgi:phosphotransacetylase